MVAVVSTPTELQQSAVRQAGADAGRHAEDKELRLQGRSNDASASFQSGECAMITQSSGAYGGYVRDAKFDWGVAPVPYWRRSRAPYATTVGGASLWVFNAPNRSAAEFKGRCQVPRLPEVDAGDD